MAENVSEKHIIKDTWEKFRGSIPAQVVCVFVLAATIITLCILVPKHKYISFEKAVENGDLYRAAEIYNKKFKKLEDQAWAENIILADADSRFAGYTAGEVTIDEITAYTEAAKVAFGFPEFEVYSEYSSSVSGSHDAYSEGVHAEEEGRLGDAVLSYSKVGGAHPNFNEAQAKAADLKGKFKAHIDESIPVWRQNGDYQTAVGELEAAVKLFGEDEYGDVYDEFLGFKNNSEKEALMSAQKLTVFNEGLLEVEGGIIVITPVKNVSDKVITEYTIAFCAYDGKNRTKIAAADKPDEKVSYMQCKNSSVALNPGESTGEEFGWSISRDTAKKINKIEACVVSATFDNGEVWQNPYFDFWCTEHNIVREESKQ